MKPIEPGCLALVVGADNFVSAIGSVVTVVEKTGDGEFHNGRVNTFGGEWCWAATGLLPNDQYSYHLPGHLLRIDGGEDESVTERHDEEIPA